MAAIDFTSLLLVVTILSLLSSGSNALGLSTDLIHIDSPLSPFYNASLTPYEHLANNLRRSHKRANHFASLLSNDGVAISSEIIPNGGSYLMKIALGTPPFTIFAIADTGSDLIWTQCTPCTQCYKQKAPLFDPKKSSPYKLLSCNSASCLSIPASDCTSNNTCEYSVLYGDSSSSRGLLASETLTLGSLNYHVALPGITFGCGFKNVGTFDENGSGVVGLGGGLNSLTTQIKSLIQGKFSYCLAPGFAKIKTHSQINFGNNAVVSGSGVVSTPIDTRSGYYFLALESLSIGKHIINLSLEPDSNRTRGNIIIDSGTTLTYLTSSDYKKFVSLVKKSIGGNTIPDPQNILDLCYRISDKPSIPIIRAHFRGARVDLKPMNTFVETSDDVTCLAFAIGTPIYGNIAQTNFLVGYDTIKQSVSFKPSKCGN